MNFQETVKQLQQEQQIHLLSIGLNQCLGAVHALQDDVASLRQDVQRMEHQNSSQHQHQQQQQQQQQRSQSSNVTNRYCLM